MPDAGHPDPSTNPHIGLSFTDQAIVAAATHPDFRGWLARIRHIGGCEHPIHLTGETLTINPATGRLLHVFSSTEQPHSRLTIACGNRRATICQPCSRLHQGDTYHLIVAGLAGGKTVPDTVRAHPRVFVTFTAPSFGPVHRQQPDRACRPRRRRATVCPHDRPLSCPARHTADDPLNGSPLCPDCYDYPAAVLWNAHTRDLWQRLHRNLYEHLASTRGTSRTAIRRIVRVSYARVAEYQRRGSVHFHAVMRFDGADGPADPPPAWATTGLLDDTIRTATRRVHCIVPGTGTTLRFGAQLDIRPIHTTDGGDELTERAVASYIAKYVTKSDLAGVTVDRRIPNRATIAVLPVTEHTRTLLTTCWHLGGQPQHAGLNLRRWAHQLGYRGHIATKSRAYSTTYTALRAARAEHRRQPLDLPEPADGTITETQWTYAGSGHTEGQAMFAAGIAHDLRTAREAAQEAARDAKTEPHHQEATDEPR